MSVQQTNPNWDKVTHDFGVVKHSQPYNCTFRYLGDKKIAKIVPGCGCTTTKRKGTDVIDVTIKFKKGKYNTTKSVAVKFEDKTTDKLRLKAIVR